MRLDILSGRQYISEPEVGSSTSDEQANKEQTLPSSMSFLPAEGVAPIKGGSSHFKRSELKGGLHTSNNI